MATEQVNPETAARATLTLLETRLRRLEFILSGKSDQGEIYESPSKQQLPTNGDQTVTTRLEKLQTDLNVLRRDHGSIGQLVQDLESLHHKVPELFTPFHSSEQPSSNSDLPKLSSTVLSHAPLYPTTASRLSSLQSLAIPNASDSGRFIAIQPRIFAALERQQQLELEAEDLKQRSAKCLEWWIKIGVVGMGEIWEDWEWRINEAEKRVNRAERRHLELDT